MSADNRLGTAPAPDGGEAHVPAPADALADLRKQARQDALALREAVKQITEAERERDRYKALAEGASSGRSFK
jgi:hypothetical protein